VPEVVSGGDGQVRVDVRVGPGARPGHYELKLHAEGGWGATSDAVVRLGVICLPEGCEEESKDIVTDVRGVPYYKEISRGVQGVKGVRVKVLVVQEQPAEECWEKKPDMVRTFYMMQDKVSLALFRGFANGPVAPGRIWDKKGDPQDPVLDVTF